MASETKRSSHAAHSATALPKPPCKINDKAIVSEKAIIIGAYPVTIGANTVVHPYAKLDSSYGSVELGAFCNISERASVGLSSKTPGSASVTLDDYITVDTGANVEASKVGRGTTIGAFSVVGSNVTIGQHCKVTPSTTVAKGSMIQDNTVCFADGSMQSLQPSADRAQIQALNLKGQAMHIETLRRLIPSHIAKWMT